MKTYPRRKLTKADGELILWHVLEHILASTTSGLRHTLRKKQSSNCYARSRMKKANVEIGRRYTAKVSGKVVSVRILRESPYGGWIAVNETTRHEVRIRSAQRLRAPLGEPIHNINWGGDNAAPR